MGKPDVLPKPSWENVAIYSFQAGISMERLKSVLQATTTQFPTKDEWKQIGQTRKNLRPQLRKLGFKF